MFKIIVAVSFLLSNGMTSTMYLPEELIFDSHLACNQIKSVAKIHTRWKILDGRIPIPAESVKEAEVEAHCVLHNPTNMARRESGAALL